MDINILNQLIKKKCIENVDLSFIDINGIDFSGCTIINVKFSTRAQPKRIITDVCFENAIFKDVDFIDAELDNVKFDNVVMDCCSFQLYAKKSNKPTINKVSFKKSIMRNCRFRDAIIKYCDFRYSEIINSTFENSFIEFCDFYRTQFVGNNIFYYSKISNSSIPSYFEGSTLRRKNIANDKIVQQDLDNYRKFLEWHEKRKNDRNEYAEFKIEESLGARYEQAENIYRELNGLWNSKGYFADANWAYIQARRMERKRLQTEVKTENMILKKLKIWLLVFWNILCDCCFGYGESIYKIIRTYVLIISFFAFLLYFFIPLDSIINSFLYSLFNMIAQTPDELKTSSVGLTFLYVIQSSVGILLTGVFGFVIANKIRNQ